jgi:hypothetical protein
VSGVYFEIRAVNVVSLHDHFEHFGLMHGTLLHEEDGLILYGNCLVHIVVQLHLQLILKLSVFLQKGFLINGVGKVLVVFGQKAHFTIVHPVVVCVSHRVLGSNAAVLSTLK